MKKETQLNQNNPMIIQNLESQNSECKRIRNSLNKLRWNVVAANSFLNVWPFWPVSHKEKYDRKFLKSLSKISLLAQWSVWNSTSEQI